MMPRKNRTLVVLFVAIAGVCAGGALLAYLATRNKRPPSEAEAVMAMLCSEEPAQVRQALYGPVYTCVPEGPLRDEAKRKVRSLLQTATDSEMTRAAILASNFGALDIVNESGGVELVRTAIERYNKQAALGNTYERLSIKTEKGHYWIGIEKRSRQTS